MIQLIGISVAFSHVHIKQKTIINMSRMIRYGLDAVL